MAMWDGNTKVRLEGEGLGASNTEGEAEVWLEKQGARVTGAELTVGHVLSGSSVGLV